MSEKYFLKRKVLTSGWQPVGQSRLRPAIFSNWAKHFLLLAVIDA